MRVRTVHWITEECNELHLGERIMHPSWCLWVKEIGGAGLSRLCRFAAQWEMRQIPVDPLEVEGVEEVNLLLEGHRHIVMFIEIVMERGRAALLRPDDHERGRLPEMRRVQSFLVGNRLGHGQPRTGGMSR